MLRGLFLFLLMLLAGCAQTGGVRNNTELAQSFLAIGFEHVQQDQRPAARSAFREAIALQPDLAPAYLGLAMVFERDGEVALAENYFQQALGLQTQPAFAHAYAQFLVTQQRLDEAAEFLRLAVTDVDYLGRAMAFEDLAMVRLYQGDDEQARLAFARAALLDETLPTPHWYLAQMALADAELALAQQHYAALETLIQAGMLAHTEQTVALGLELSLALQNKGMQQRLEDHMKLIRSTQP